MSTTWVTETCKTTSKTLREDTRSHNVNIYLSSLHVSKKTKALKHYTIYAICISKFTHFTNCAIDLLYLCRFLLEWLNVTIIWTFIYILDGLDCNKRAKLSYWYSYVKTATNCTRISGKGVEVVVTMERMRLVVLSIQETKWRRDRAMAGWSWEDAIFYVRMEINEVVESVSWCQKRSVRRQSELNDGKGESSWHGLWSENNWCVLCLCMGHRREGRRQRNRSSEMHWRWLLEWPSWKHCYVLYDTLMLTLEKQSQ